MQNRIHALRAQAEESLQKGQAISSANFVLYTWDPDEPRSAQALGVLEESGADAVVDVVDCRSLTLGEIPEWLVGVPTLLSVNDMQVFKGTEALYHIQDIGKHRDQYPAKHVEAKPPPDFQMPRMRELPPQIKQNTDDMPSNDGRSFIEPIQEKKEDTQDLQKEIEAIMKRREEMMQQQPAL